MWRQLISRSAVGSPAARSSHSVTAIGNKVFVFSGENKPRTPVSNDLHCYDLDKGSWSICKTTATVPSARVGHAMAAVGTKLYLFGGRTEVVMGEGLLDDLNCYDTVSNTWSLLETTGDKPCGRSYHAMASQGDQVYLFGGCTKDRHNDLYSFDTKTSHWSKLPTNEAIKPRGGPGLAVVGHCIYIIAGFTGEEIDDMYYFDMQNKTWHTVHAQPNIPPISVFGITTVQDTIVIFGGEVKPSSEGHAGAGGFSDDVYMYNTQKPQEGWQVMSKSGVGPSPRGWLPITTTEGDEIIIFGGLAPSNERLDDLWALKL